MADGNQQLVIDLEARLTKFEKAFKKASGIANDNWKSVENRGTAAAARLDASFTRLEKPRHVKIHVEESGIAAAQAALNHLQLPHNSLNFEHLKGGLGGIAAGLGLQEVAKLSDAWTQAGNRIAAADVEARKVPIVLGEVAEIALRSRTSLESVAQVFAGLNRAGQTFGASQAQALVATEAVSKAMTLSGSTRAEIQGALSDLTQGLQAGVLQGQELKALLREVPDFASALAKELHVGVGELKEMGSQGEITSEKVFNALLHAAPAINEKFGKTVATIEQAFGNLETAASRFVGTNSTIQAAVRATTAGIQGLASHFGLLGNGAAALGIIVATRLIAAGLAPLTASLAANARQAIITGAAHVEFASIVGMGATRMLAAGVAARVFSTALALVGGPVGAVILGIATAATWYAGEAQRAETASTKYAEAYDKLKASAMGAAGGIKQAGDAVAETAARMNAVEVNKLGQELKETERDAVSAVSGLQSALVEYQLQASSAGEASSMIFDKVAPGAAEAEHALKDVEAALHGDANAALRAQTELAALANAHPDLQPLANAFNPLLQKLAGVRAALAALKSEIEGLNAPAAKPADTHWTGKFEVGKARDEFAGQIMKDRIDAANKDDAYRIRKKASEILKDNQGIVSIGDAWKTGAKEIAIEDEGTGSKGRKAKAHKPKKTDEQKEAEKHDKAVKSEIESLQEESRVQDAEAAAQGKSNAEKRTATELAKLKVDAASREGQSITTLITKIEQEKVALAKLDAQRKAIAELSSTFRSSFADAFDEIIVKGGKAQLVFANLLKSFESMALKGLLTGEGPFGGMMGGLFGGTSGAPDAKNPAGGGLFGAMLKGLHFFADGGEINGPGGPRSDNIVARVSPGEFVVNAKSAQGNLALLHAINSGKIPAFANGGQVGGGSVPSFSGMGGGSGAPVNLQNNITLHANGTPEENAALSRQAAQHMEDSARRIFADEARRQMRPGGMLDGTNFTR